MTIIVKGASIAMMQAQQLQPRTRRYYKEETSGRSGKFMPQVSRDENVEFSIKTHNEEFAKNNKKMQPHDTCATRHARDTHLTSNANNQLTPFEATTKQAQARMTTTKTKITIFILIKKIEGRLCCCGVLCKSDH
jgi:hypothetical protein